MNIPKGNQKSLSQKTGKSVANKVKQKLNTVHTTIQWKLNNGITGINKIYCEFGCSGRVSNSGSTGVSGRDTP